MAFLCRGVAAWACPDLRRSALALQSKTLCTDHTSRPRAIGELLQEKLEASKPRCIEDIRKCLESPEIRDWVWAVAQDHGYDGYEQNHKTFAEIKIHFSGKTRGSCLRYYNPEIHRPYAGFRAQKLTPYLYKQVVTEHPKRSGPGADRQTAGERFGKITDSKLRKKGLRYYMTQAGKKRHFHFRWNIFTSLDYQITGNIIEREWLVRTLRDIEEVQGIFTAVKGIKRNISAENKSKIEKILKQISNRIGSGHISLTDKVRAAGYVKAAKADYDDGKLENIRSAYGNLNRVKKSLENRKKKVEGIYANLRKILKMAQNWAEETNSYMAKVAASGEVKSLYALGNRDEIKVPENEPEFEGLFALIEEAIRHINAGPAGDETVIDKNLASIVKEMGAANLLSRLRGEFQDTYYEARYGRDAISAEIFYKIWNTHSQKDLIRAQPAYWYAKFYQAAFIHRTAKILKKYSDRISNPLFEASTAFIQMLKIQEPDSILKTQSLLPEAVFQKTRAFLKSVKERKKTTKRSVSDLSLKEKHDLIRVLAKDKGLSKNGLTELNKCAEFFFYGCIDSGRGKRKGKKPDSVNAGPRTWTYAGENIARDGSHAELTPVPQPNLHLSPDQIEHNAEKIVPLLISALMTLTNRSEEDVVLLLDMPAVQSERIKNLLDDCIIKPLMRVNGNNEDVKKILKKLTVAGRKDKGVVERRMARGALKSENVIIVTDNLRLEDFAKFTNSLITALGLSGLNAKEKFDWEKYYYPYVEAAFFSVIRVLGRDINDLLKWYNAIPNVKKLNEIELAKMCFDADGNLRKAVVLELMPEAANFDPDDLQRLYEKIQKFIRNA